jgi:hypothetical protein
MGLRRSKTSARTQTSGYPALVTEVLVHRERKAGGLTGNFEGLLFDDPKNDIDLSMAGLDSAPNCVRKDVAPAQKC